MAKYNDIKTLSGKVSELERIIKEMSGAPRASHTSIHDGGISEYDADGTLVSRLGTQHDGTHGAVDLYGPKPPTPTDPSLGGAPVSLTITWDGLCLDDIGDPRPLPLDFQATQILAKKDSPPALTGNDDLKGVITSEAGGEKSLTVEHGTWYVALRMRTKSGRVSDASSVVSVVVPSTVDVGQIEADIAQAQADAAAALDGASAAEITAVAAQAAADAAADDAAEAAADAAEAAGLVAGKGKVIIQAAAPDVSDQLPQNLWIDTTGGTNTPKRWTGTEWSAVTDKAATDAAAAAATALSTANTAASDAAAANTAAGNALTAANGKNRISFGTSAPTAATPGRPGDVFWVRSGSTITGQYLNTVGTDTTSGNTWTAQTLTNATISTLDAAKITTGTLNAGRIGAKSISTEKLMIGSTDNLVDDPNFATLGTTNTVWGATSTAIVADATGGRTGGSSLRLVLDGLERSVTSSSQWKSAQPDAAYRLSMWVRSSVNLPAGAITSCLEQTTVESALLLTGAATSYASSPDSATVDIVGDMNARARVALDDWTPATEQTLVAKWTTSGNQRSHAFSVLPTGRLRFSWTTDGITVISRDSTVAPTVANGAVLWVRAELDVDNGASGHTVTFYTSVDGELWIPLGAPVITAGVTSIFSSSAPVTVGAQDLGASNRVIGKVFTAEIYPGLGTGSAVLDPEFSAVAAGTTSFDDGNAVWTIHAGASIVGGVVVVSEISSESVVGAITAGVSTFVPITPLTTSHRAVSVRPVVRVSPLAGSSGNVWVDQVTVTRAMTGNLIVDGSIVASKLATDSVTADQIMAGSVTGESLAGEIVLGSTIKTSEAGQRVEMDTSGFRLYDASETIRVNLPTEFGADPSFRGRVEADGLTVREGATFYSPQNEFARESVINLAEQVAGPVAGPAVNVNWDFTQLAATSRTGTLGTFSLDTSQVTSIGRDEVNNRIIVNQARPGGTRSWFYNANGSVATADDVLDNLRCTGRHISASGISTSLYRWHDGVEYKWLVYDSRYPTGYRDYITGYENADVTMSWDGTHIILAETITNGVTRFRRIDASTNPVTILETTLSTGIAAPSSNPVFVFRGPADFGADKWIVSYNNNGIYRVFNSAGAYESVRTWSPPVAKVGALWNSTDQKFYTLGTDRRLYRHSSLTWTDPALDTWHLGQSFFNDGTNNETAMGAVTTFTMKKRAQITVSLADVPYSGEPDDPDAWNLFGKRGAAPAADNSDMFLMAAGWHYNLSYITSTAPPTSGTAAKQFGTFPGGTPATLQSQRVLPSDSSKKVFEVRGDGSGRWGPFEFKADGTASTIVPLTLASGVVVSGGQTPFAEFVGGTVYLGGRVSWADLTGTPVPGVDTNIQLTSVAIPAYMRPAQANQDVGIMGNSATGAVRLWVTSTGHLHARVIIGAAKAAFLGGSYRAGT